MSTNVIAQNVSVHFDVFPQRIKNMPLAAVTKNIKGMYSDSDFDGLFIRYKAEAMSQDESIQDFCLKKTGTL